MRDEHRELERLARLLEHGLNQPLGRRELIRRGLALGLSLSSIGTALAACGLEPSGEPASNISPWRPSSAGSPAPAGGSTPLAGNFVPVASPSAAVQPTATIAPTAAPTLAPLTRFAVIGDFGMEGEPAAAVAALVASWAPDFVLTTGDNNYPDGAADTIDRNVGQYYQQFIAPYRGAYGPGAAENRFFPVLGNHDWVVGYPEPYLSYFSLPGVGRYYTLERGLVRIFALDSMPGEPDGIDAGSVQAQWFQAELATSTARWNIAIMHHPPFSSGHWGPSGWMQWPFAEWGVQLVLAGHDHSYERIQRGNMLYVVNGLGGGARYAPGMSGVEGSQLFFNADHGAMLVEADASQLRARFYTRANLLVDEFSLS